MLDWVGSGPHLVESSPDQVQLGPSQAYVRLSSSEYGSSWVHIVWVELSLNQIELSCIKPIRLSLSFVDPRLIWVRLGEVRVKLGQH